MNMRSLQLPGDCPDDEGEPRVRGDRDHAQVQVRQTSQSDD